MPKVLFITGEAGSGKTHILAEKMRQLLLEDADNKCIYVSFNSAMVDKIRTSMDESDIRNKNKFCFTVNELFRNLHDCFFSPDLFHIGACKAGPQLDEISYDLYNRVTKSNDYRTAKLIENFSDFNFFVDEYQDLDGRCRDVIEKVLLENNEKNKFRWVIFDNSQRVLPDSQPVVLIKFPLVTLPAVYRLPVEIYKFVKPLRWRTEPSSQTSENSLAVAFPVANRKGVELICLHAWESEFEKLKSELDKLRKENLPPKSITVLVETEAVLKTLDQEIGISSLCREYAAAVTTVSKFKGLESPVVVAFFPHSLNQKGLDGEYDLLEKARAVLHTAGSRATCMLVVIAHYHTYNILKELCTPQLIEDKRPPNFKRQRTESTQEHQPPSKKVNN